MAKCLTIRQADILVTIRNYQHIHGMMPSIRELSALTQKARGTILQHLCSLDKKGVIRRHRKKARAIEILQPA